MHIAFNINNLGMEGLGATLSSLVQHCSDSTQLQLHFLCAKLSNPHKGNIKQLLASEGFEGSCEFLDFDAEKEFGHLHSLHGDWTAYGRLLIPKLINTEKVLYLDADLLVLLDILKLSDFQIDTHPIAAINTGQAINTRDSHFYCEVLQLATQTPIFNSGVMLFNTDAWEAQNIDQKCQEIGEKYTEYLLCADQTLLNAVFAGQFAQLPDQYNHRWFPTDISTKPSKEIVLHFVGSPKPWDFFGKRIHPAYHLWKKYNPKFWAKTYNKTTFQKIYRTWNIKKSIVRCLLNQFKSKGNASVNYHPTKL
ncbi:MAG: glycosyltransferase [Bacteroidota bacterium]